jgi:hypothetical protein
MDERSLRHFAIPETRCLNAVLFLSPPRALSILWMPTVGSGIVHQWRRRNFVHLRRLPGAGHATFALESDVQSVTPGARASRGQTGHGASRWGHSQQNRALSHYLSKTNRLVQQRKVDKMSSDAMGAPWTSSAMNRNSKPVDVT